MFSDIGEAPKPVASATGIVEPVKLETVPEDAKTATVRGPSKAPTTNAQQANGTTAAPEATATATATATAASKEFPSKTDKPRPHVCLTCKRSFARLEHLKRHERSHTKEKPFECPECTRCFARRDLLLRHQQKLHMTTTPSSRPRAGRRESASSSISAAGKIRKNSGVHPNGSMRPRANTISNIGNPALEMFAGAGGPPGGIHSPQPTVVFGRMLSDAPQHLRQHIIPGHHGVPTGLPKLNTSIANSDMSGGMRTAPIFSDPNFSMDTLFSPDSTVNPAALHFPEGPHTAGLDSPSPFQEVPSGMPMGHLSMDLAGGMDWMNDFGTDLSLINTNDSQAIAGSSPSVIDTDSPEDASEYALDRKPSIPQHTAQWQGPALFPKSAAATLPEYMMGMGLDPFSPGPPSPGMMADFPAEGHLPPNPHFQLHNPLNPMSPVHGMMPQQQQQQQHIPHHHMQHQHQFPHHQFPPPMRGGESPSTMASTTDASVRQGSIGAGLAITIPESTRNAMMITLAQPSTFGSRKYSQPTISSPLSPGFAAKAQQAVNMPSTAEFQRFIVAYVKYFHPHMPFFHIPTLSFDIPFSSGQQGGRSNSPVFGVANSGGCLILAMSAIGALYEGEVEISKTLFNFSKRMLSIFLEERRKADISSAFGSAKDNSGGAPCPPVWLVQAMLLNVIYGHMCGDKTAEINAHTHGAALVGLARGAKLTEPSKKAAPAGPGSGPSDAHVEGWNPRGEDPAWYEWHVAEEKKRTLYAVFNVSSMLTSAYNHSPALRNGEIKLDLPCDEDLWAAESAEAWYSLGGSMAVDQNSVPFNLALNNLLTAHTRQPIPMYQMSQTFCKPNGGQAMPPDWPRAEFHASTFGCVVLINALHNYIWETRQRHGGRQWTASETEDMHRQIEPALVAWQAIWSAIPHHSVERPNPFGMGPLAADSIPLLDLAYLVMYVNPGKSKECFWNRDFEGMSQEIASGYELVQHAEQEAGGGGGGGGGAAAAASAGGLTAGVEGNGSGMTTGQRMDGMQQRHDDAGQQQDGEAQARKASRRERHLRKAAMHAANSLVLSGRNNTTFADFTSRELPIQAALCMFTCSQVLAEWVATVQERVGPYLGILGVDHIDLHNVPALVLLEQEDITLFEQIVEILGTGEVKMHNNLATQNGTFQPTEKLAGMGEGEAGYSARLLHVTGSMLDSASVWPVTQLMKQGLDVQAKFMKDRAEQSRVHKD